MLTTTGRDIEKAADFLSKGGVVAIPTETVYGLAGNALDENVVLQIFKLKNRPSFDPLIVHIADVGMLSEYVNNIPEKAKPLIEHFWPGPLTILFNKKSIIPDIVTSGLDTVAVRVPSHPLTLKLLKQLNFPLAAPSANPFGYISPTSAVHVAQHFTGKIPYILDGGSCEVGIESTIIGFENDNCIIYRLGGVPVSAIEKYVGKAEVRTHSTSDAVVPGSLKSHYAPQKELFFGNVQKNISLLDNSSKVALICLKAPDYAIQKNVKIFELSPDVNLEEAAYKLFATLRELDNSEFDFLVAEKFPDTGLGKAINDRLQRASAENKGH